MTSLRFWLFVWAFAFAAGWFHVEIGEAVGRPAAHASDGDMLQRVDRIVRALETIAHNTERCR